MSMSVLNDDELRTILFAVMVKRLGGTVVIRQEDVDDIAYNRLMEHHNEDGSIEFVLNVRKRAS